ncbi:16S rRNA (cytosine(1402)-N(4))-methyltransferase RsmH [Candidatus Woesebacteria bacterium]|nr:16S rRNA (cytosine(1402)-N(4))-methyltransferase RsmH [Candidatus Woesebacteria bacterium]
MHTPVFLEKVLSHVHRPPDIKYIDCTLGEGGHTRALAKMGLEVLAMDADRSQLDAFDSQELTTAERARITLVEGNFAHIRAIAKKHGFTQCDGVLFDLGLSMRQLNTGDGFSYKYLHQPLDMIINTVAKQGGATRAADVVTLYTYDELTAVIERYGERVNAPKIARAIVTERAHKKIETVGDLVQIVSKVTSQHDLPALFQAIRIEVNGEFQNLIEGLDGAMGTVRPGGTLQVIAFHSGEDRIVKLWARKNKVEEVAKYVGRAISKDKFEKSAVLRVYRSSL